MSRDSRYTEALAVLRALALPLDADDVTERAAVRDAYPFGERAYWPYTAWRKAVKDWSAERAKLRAWQGGGR